MLLYLYVLFKGHPIILYFKTAMHYVSSGTNQAAAESKIKSSLALMEAASCIHWEEVTDLNYPYHHINFYGETSS